MIVCVFHLGKRSESRAFHGSLSQCRNGFGFVSFTDVQLIFDMEVAESSTIHTLSTILLEFTHNIFKVGLKQLQLCHFFNIR